jgi:hypothetical protein
MKEVDHEDITAKWALNAARKEYVYVYRGGLVFTFRSANGTSPSWTKMYLTEKETVECILKK